MPLEEIAKLFDGEDANVGGTAATTHAKEHLRDLKERGLAEHAEVVVEYTGDAETGAEAHEGTKAK